MLDGKNEAPSKVGGVVSGFESITVGDPGKPSPMRVADEYVI
jgi:hypothetical protein